MVRTTNDPCFVGHGACGGFGIQLGGWFAVPTKGECRGLYLPFCWERTLMVVPAYYGFFGRFNILEGNSFQTRRTFILGREEIKYSNFIIFVDISTSLAVSCVAVGVNSIASSS